MGQLEEDLQRLRRRYILSGGSFRSQEERREYEIRRDIILDINQSEYSPEENNSKQKD